MVNRRPRGISGLAIEQAAGHLWEVRPRMPENIGVSLGRSPHFPQCRPDIDQPLLTPDGSNEHQGAFLFRVQDTRKIVPFAASFHPTSGIRLMRWAHGKVIKLTRTQKELCRIWRVTVAGAIPSLSSHSL